MLKYLWFFRDIKQFKSYFRGVDAIDVRRKVIRRGWHLFNMQAVVYVAGVAVFNSIEMQSTVTYLGVGFLAFSAIIYH